LANRTHRASKEEFARQESEKFSTGIPVETGSISTGYSNSQWYNKRVKVKIMPKIAEKLSFSIEDG
jgi:hypothetical protein